MKRIIPLICSIAMLVGCEMLTTDNAPDNNENVEDNQKVTLYHITDDIDVFESVFLAEDGNCLAIKKDTTFGFVAVIDSLKVDDEKALVVYIDSLGKVRRVFNDGKSLDISYNSDGNVNLWYRDGDGTSEVFNEIQYTSTKAITKAGEVFDPTDLGNIVLALLDLTDLKKAIRYDPIIGKVLAGNVAVDLLTTGPFSNFHTELATGITSVGIAAIIGTNLPLAALLATIGVADAVISDWQNMIADIYFGTAIPITGDAVQLTDNHFVISYSLNGVNPNQTDFNIGVIIADGLFITKNHHLLKKSVSYDKSDTGYIIVNLKGLDRKKGDKLKYRIYLEPANDNGFKWDDKLLDYWRYGKVKDFVIDEPALKVESAVQTGTSSYHGYKYTFKVDVNVINDIPLDLDEWGVAIYKTSLDECTNEDQQCDIKSAEGNGRQTISFSIDVNDVMMDTEKVPYKPIMNHFAVPYISLNGNKYGLFDNAKRIDLEYSPIYVTIDNVSWLINDYIYQDAGYIRLDIDYSHSLSGDLDCCFAYENYDGTIYYFSERNLHMATSMSETISQMQVLEDLFQVNHKNFVATKHIRLFVWSKALNCQISPDYEIDIIYNERPELIMHEPRVIEEHKSSSGTVRNRYACDIDIKGGWWIDYINQHDNITRISHDAYSGETSESTEERISLLKEFPARFDDFVFAYEERYEGRSFNKRDWIKVHTTTHFEGVLFNGERITSSSISYCWETILF